MKLLFMTGSLVQGGAERHTITLVNGLARRGHECHAVYVKNEAAQLDRLHGAASVECLYAPGYLDLAALQRLAQIIGRLQPAVVIAANPYAMLYASIALKRSCTRAPLVVTYHTTLLPNAKTWLQMLYYRPLFWSADCLVFVCDAQRRYWRARLVAARASRVIYNGVDPQYWRAPGPEVRAHIRRVLGLAERDYVIAMSAVFRAEKNHLQLVEALARLRARGLPARALLIGDGPMRAAIEQRARALGLGADVLIAGLQQDVRPFLAAADALALCSTAVETFSLAALEAMALGLPPVLSDIGGAADMVRPGREGYLFPAGDTAALVECLAALADEGLRRRMGASARETVEARFSERAMLEAYEQLLQGLVLKRRRRENLRGSAAAH